MPSPFESLCGPGKPLRAEPPDAAEFDGLKRSGLARLAKDGDALFDHFHHRLEERGKQVGTLALIFGKAQNKFQDPAQLRRGIVDVLNGEDGSAGAVGAHARPAIGPARRTGR